MPTTPSLPYVADPVSVPARARITGVRAWAPAVPPSSRGPVQAAQPHVAPATSLSGGGHVPTLDVAKIRPGCEDASVRQAPPRAGNAVQTARSGVGGIE